MGICKKCLSAVLAAVLIVQAGAFMVSAESADNEKKVITISNIDTSQLIGETSESSTEIDTKGLPSDGIKIVSEEWSGPAEYVISGKNISVRGGTYSYRLVIRSDRTLTFDNDLEIYYQGVNGRYKLHYDIDETDNHTMIVTGDFDNIIVSSPLLERISESEREWILSHISEDTYFYQLVLKTKEGFSFINTLRFLYDAKKCGYSIRYSYDLLTDRQTLIFCGIPGCYRAGAETDRPDAGSTAPAPDTSGTEPEKPEGDSETGQAPKTDDADGKTQAAAPRKADGKTAVIRYSKLRKKAQTVKASKVMETSGVKKGKATYIKESGHKKISVNKKTGKVKVKKGLKRGTYKVTVKLKPAGNKSKASAGGRVTFYIRVV